MPPHEVSSLWGSLAAAGALADRWIWGPDATVSLDRLSNGSSLGGRLEEVRGRSVLVMTADPLAAALALIEIDGIARRLVLCPPDLAIEHVPYVLATAGVDVIVSDRSAAELGPQGTPCIPCAPRIAPAPVVRRGTMQTEWILFTSGTTGVPKMVIHNLCTLAGAIPRGGPLGGPAVWATFYDIRRYGGLQILLRALLGGGSLVMSGASEPTAEFLARAGSRRVSHLTGTPSHWRRVLMNPAVRCVSPTYARLSGEIADQGILDSLRAFYPGATIAHAFASTEAGVGFEVVDGMAGFPASFLTRLSAGADLKIEDGSLRIRSARTALAYVGGAPEPLLDTDGFVDTGDIVELRDGRCYFAGRRGGIINVGGLKVHPEEVESVINRHPDVRMSRVKSRRNPVTGAVVVAEVVLAPGAGSDDATHGYDLLTAEILDDCRRALAAHKVPASIRVVPSLEVTPSGKMVRRNA
jgi:acyl-coenzyme A synthetase/AMP-(fatty) acid ligase